MNTGGEAAEQIVASFSLLFSSFVLPFAPFDFSASVTIEAVSTEARLTHL